MNRTLLWLAAVATLPGSLPRTGHQLCAQTPALFLSPAPAQSPAPVLSPARSAGRPEFDVASVKRSKSDGESRSNLPLDNGNIYSTVNRTDVFVPSGGYFVATNQPLWRYISFAYKLSGTQELALRFKFFTGLSSQVPDWVGGGIDIGAQRFDIEARAEGSPTRDQVRLMMQSLLTDRFKLAVHFETRQVPVFALVLAKPGKIGPRIQPHPADDSCAQEPGAGPAPGPASSTVSRSSVVGELPIVCGVIAHVPTATTGGWQYGGRNVTLALLATSLPTMTGMAILSRPVIDRTGLSGTFDFNLGGWASQAAADAGEPGPPFSDVLRDQLGLKLERQEGPVDLLVIDRIEHPSEN
jgi:uncharacterized protein (TIGR03435 family)